jgi:hypothetical protein
MNAETIVRWITAWVFATVIACVVVHRVYALDIDRDHPRAVIASVWNGGQLIERAVVARVPPHGQAQSAGDPTLDAALASHPDATLVYESIVGEGPLVAWSQSALAMSVVAGHDGISATLGDRTAYVTPDDLLARQGYDRGIRLGALELSTGVDVPLALAVLSDRLGTNARDLLDNGRLRRIRVERTLASTAPPRIATADTVTDARVRDAAAAAGRYLARGVDTDGRFRYAVDAPTNTALPGYDWPRHAGATYFLAQIAALSGDTDVAWAALRAASLLRDHAMVLCGEHRCIGDARVVDVGAAALTVLAFVEMARTKLDAAYGLLVPELTAFLRAQQRPDGELMHLYDRAAQRPIDVQLLYYSGEAAFALSRAHALLGDGRDLDAAKRAVEHQVAAAWSFFGSRYYWGEEHWTCQAMDDLWNRAPSARALQFCLDWQEYNRKLQYGTAETPYDADGAYGFGPLLTPRLTPVGSRTEAALATLDAARRAGVAASDLEPLDRQIRRSLALLLRHQLRSGDGNAHLLADPASVDGAMPGTEVDWQLRIDYSQHAGCALVRWLERGKAL